MLPKDKKLVRVEYLYEDGTRYVLDEQNAIRFDKNIKSTDFLAITRNWQFLPVEWIVIEPEVVESENK